MPKRSPDQTVAAISLEKELLKQLDARAESLHLSRSAYIIQLIRNDLVKKGKLEVQPEDPPLNITPMPEAQNQFGQVAEAPLPYKARKKKKSS